MDSSCLFCRIANNEIPCRKAYEDDEIVAFHDIHPQAPVHILIIPKAHFPAVDQMAGQELLLGKLLLVASRLAHEAGLTSEDGGYRVIINKGRDAGQAVFHLHLHLLGGRSMGWPPG
jgi:histidine triad (HIT) family protein